ncbi:MAG: hypothetical protein Q8R15_04455 [Candidatus Micrarchaeota archaeon]|nr:hypothetical protein [Candidatus Micrarchaeota archaeon]
MSLKEQKGENKLMVIRTEAPCKVIITGEHGVVHGSPGIAIPIEPTNRIVLKEKKGKPAITFKSHLGEVKLDKNLVSQGEEGPFKPFTALLRHFGTTHGFKPKGAMSIEIKADVPKGVGASASISAALSLALFQYLGKTPKTGASPEQDELWNAVQVAEEVAHSGRPSGIDAMTVLRGPTRLIRSVEAGKPKWNFQRVNVSLPRGTTLLIIDTFKGKRSSTGEMVKKVAASLGLTKPDGSVKSIAEFTSADHAKVKGFRSAFEEVSANLHKNGNVTELGSALNNNHEILMSHGASSEEIQHAIRTLRGISGVFGAKLTGAGGEGGAVIALIKKAQARKIITKLKQSGFNAFEAKPTKGAVE